jgi:hypothetical protein
LRRTQTVSSFTSDEASLHPKISVTAETKELSSNGELEPETPGFPKPLPLTEFLTLSRLKGVMNP